MKAPASISPWLSEGELADWLREAPDKAAYQKRMTIWLTLRGFHAPKVADMLQVSVQAVWLWVGQYNREGPAGLYREGRGGRRWSLMSFEDEEAFLGRMESKALTGGVITAKGIWPDVCKEVGQDVSLGYVYRLLHRHQWRKQTPRPRHVKANSQLQDEFKKNSPRR